MAIVANLSIDQGSTFSAGLTISSSAMIPFDLTGYSATSQIRKTYSSSVAQTFTCAINLPNQGIVELLLTDEQTAVLKPGRYVYDVILDKGGVIYRAIEGIITVNPSVTR